VRDDIYYSVEIASSSHIYKNAVLRLYDDIYIRRATPISDNKYYVGIQNDYEKIKLLQEELSASSAPYAKIVAFYNGMPLRKSKASSILNDYPELKDYLEDKGK